MRRLSLIVFFVCLMTSSALAETNTWNAATGYWNVNQSPNGLTPGTACPNTIWSSGVVPADTEQVKILGGNVCDLDADAGTFTANKVTVGTSATLATLNVKSGGLLTSVVEIQVGDASGKTGAVNQTGGTITLSGTSSKDSKLEVGYKGGPGYYTISGGSIVTGANLSQLLVGPSGGNGGTGTFTVDGTGGSISVSKLYVGVGPATGEDVWYTGTGTVEFKLGDSVSPINVATSVIIDPCGTATANLIVTLLDANVAPPVIPLIITSGATAVRGTFDSVTLNGAGLAGYTLVYNYNADGGAIGNDIALIPEPATIALLGLGSLIAIRRKRK